jgi:type IV pilus assembly protein PilQ
MLLLPLNAQVKNDASRIQHINKTLDSLATSIPGLLKPVTFNVGKIELSNFIVGVANSHQINVSVDNTLKNVYLTHNFSQAIVKDVFLYLCKEHRLTIDYIGNILSFKKYSELPKVVVYTPREIPMSYDKIGNKISLDVKKDSLATVFRKITDLTGKNLMFLPVSLGNKKLSVYIKGISFDSAIDKLAFANDLIVTKTKDDVYVFEEGYTNVKGNPRGGTVQRPKRYRKTNFFFKIKDKETQTLEVDFENVAIADIVNDISLELGVNMFISSPLTGAGKATMKTNAVTFKTLLDKIFENTKFTYKETAGVFYFGDRSQVSQRQSVIVPLLHRSIEIMNEPMSSSRNNGSFNQGNNNNVYSQNGNNAFGQNNRNFNRNTNNQPNSYNNNRQNLNTTRSKSFTNTSGQSKGEALLSILPEAIVKGLDIKTDIEQNSFIVTGDAQKIKEFESFVKKIDKPVPVIIIEVMILEVSKSTSVSTGVSLGIGNEPTTTSGTVFPNANLNLGATTINKIIGGFKGFGSSNLGKVVPNFYAKIEALETNGDVKIRSTPKLSTLNGHQATLSNGERSYYAVTQRNIYGSQNPQTSEIKNYVPIDADLSIAIRPLVSGDGQITMSINVVQSSFNGKRIDEDAPPGVNSREFNSTIRVKDQDVIILGGLEENVKNSSGSGVPFLARIPIIKYLFSKRTRTASKTKLSVLIKPIIIQ